MRKPTHKLPKATAEFLASKDAQCAHVRKAIERFDSQLNDDRFVFDAETAEKAHEICRQFAHYQGREFKGKAFDPLPWQSFIVSNLYGLRWKETGLSVYQSAYVQVPKKNGKTELGAALAAIRFFLGDEGAEIYFAATSEEQAKKPFDTARIFLKASIFAPLVEFRCDRMLFDARKSSMRYLAADSETQDGLNIDFALCDEIHDWPSRAMWDTLENGMAAREEPLIVAITTAGCGAKSATSFCAELRQQCIDALYGTRPDDTLFALIYEPDKDDDFYDEKTWLKVNPSLPAVKKLGFMRSMMSKARAYPTARAGILSRQLNVWMTETGEGWGLFEKWKALEKPIPLDALRGKNCYGGLDLSSSRDLTSFVLVFPKQSGLEKEHVVPLFWIPRITALSNGVEHKIPYETWAEKGFCELVESEIVRTEFVREKIVSLKSMFQIVKIGFDRWLAAQIATDLTEAGFVMQRVNQGHYLSPTIHALEERIVSGELTHAQNEVLDWNVLNVRIRRSKSDAKVALSKNSDWEKIDGVPAMANAYDVLLADAALAQSEKSKLSDEQKTTYFKSVKFQ